MFDEEGGGDHADAVMHPAGLPELAQAGIHDGDARMAALPGAEILGRAAEFQICEGGTQGFVRQSGVVPQQIGREIRQMSSRRYV